MSHQDEIARSTQAAGAASIASLGLGVAAVGAAVDMLDVCRILALGAATFLTDHGLRFKLSGLAWMRTAHWYALQQTAAPLTQDTLSMTQQQTLFDLFDQQGQRLLHQLPTMSQPRASAGTAAERTKETTGIIPLQPIRYYKGAREGLMQVARDIRLADLYAPGQLRERQHTHRQRQQGLLPDLLRRIAWHNTAWRYYATLVGVQPTVTYCRGIPKLHFAFTPEQRRHLDQWFEQQGLQVLTATAPLPYPVTVAELRDNRQWTTQSAVLTSPAHQAMTQRLAQQVGASTTTAAPDPDTPAGDFYHGLIQQGLRDYTY